MFSCPWLRSSIQAVDVEAVAVTVKELVSYALTLNANNQSWLITQADIYFGEDERRTFNFLLFLKHTEALTF